MKLYRDDKGRFVKGHKALCPRDNKGCFISKKSMENTKERHTRVKREVDEFLKKYDGVAQ